VPNAEYVGFLTSEDALSLEANCDVMITLYDPEDPISHFSMGNKMFEAMMLGLPIITNVATELIRDEIACGIVVDYNNASEIRSALVRLRDNKQLCTQLGENGRNAFLHKYNWAVMEENIYKIYDRLLKQK
jgi:glycosyltransferase involved in cell wall biosynthesis